MWKFCFKRVGSKKLFVLPEYIALKKLKVFFTVLVFHFNPNFSLFRPPRPEVGLESSFVALVRVRAWRDGHARTELQVTEEGSDVDVVLNDSPFVGLLITWLVLCRVVAGGAAAARLGVLHLVVFVAVWSVVGLRRIALLQRIHVGFTSCHSDVFQNQISKFFFRLFEDDLFTLGMFV